MADHEESEVGGSEKDAQADEKSIEMDTPPDSQVPEKCTDAEDEKSNMKDTLEGGNVSANGQTSSSPTEPERIVMTVDSLVNNLEDLSCEPEVPKSEYIFPIEDPLGKAGIYYAKHAILNLFQNITAGIAYHRPENPLDFMIDQIEHLQAMDRKKKGMARQPSKDDQASPDTPVSSPVSPPESGVNSASEQEGTSSSLTDT